MHLYDFLNYQARERAEADFAIQDNRRLTKSEALAETNRPANASINAGLQIGDWVAIPLYLAASTADVVSIPINYQLAPVEWRYIFNYSGTELLLAAGQYL